MLVSVVSERAKDDVYNLGMSIEQQIRNEVYRALVFLGASRELLGTVGSWGDTLPDEEILRVLKRWNEEPEKIPTDPGIKKR